MHRILLVTNRYPIDGNDPASPFVPQFVAALIRCGVGVDVLTPRYAHRPPSAEPSFVHRFESTASSPIGSWNLLSPVSWLRLARFFISGLDCGRRLCSETRYDHIFALWALPSGEFARRLSIEFDTPYSVWCLGSDIYSWARRPVFNRLIARSLGDAAHVFGDGEDLCAHVKSSLSIDCQYLPSFHPLNGHFSVRNPLASETPRFLYVGRIHKAKGVFELVEAFARIRRSLPGATLRIVGNGPHLSELLKRLRVIGLSDSVICTGPVEQNQIASAYCQCDFVVIPTKSDSLPLVFSEAVQACRPVVGTDVGDLGTFIRRYDVGLVAGSSEPKALADSMHEMAEKPRFSIEGRARLLNLLDPDSAARAFCERVFGVGVVPHDPTAHACDSADSSQPVAMSP